MSQQSVPESALSALKLDETQSIDFGSVALGEDGHIRRRPSDSPLHFSFLFRDVLFQASIDGGESPSLSLKAELGELPFTAQSPTARQLCKKIIQASHDGCPSGGLGLLDDSLMVYQASAVPPVPRNSVSVIATAVTMVLEITPYLDLLALALDTVSKMVPPASPDTSGTADDPATEPKAAASKTA